MTQHSEQGSCLQPGPVATVTSDAAEGGAGDDGGWRGEDTAALLLG